jgi:uncharacterized membrane protein YhaH (DUF805 family)
MYCHKCGTNIPEDARFCENCGSPVAGTSGNDHSSNVVSSAPILVQGTWSFGRLFSGRLGRMRYFQGVLLSTLPFFLLVSLWGIINILTGTISVGGGSSTSVPTSPDLLLNVINNIAIPILFALAFLFFIATHFPLAIRRCHDFGTTGWLSLLTLIPYVGEIVALFFLFKRGDPGVNQYGVAPDPNRRFLADIFNY